MVAVHAAITWFLVGLIWVIQVVHYPSMHFVAPERFAAFERQHTRRMGWIAAPSMLLEGFLAVTLMAIAASFPLRFFAGLGLALGAVNWISTFWIQVPLHDQLQAGKNTDTIDRLVKTNWIRTSAWTGRGVVALVILLSD